MSSELTVTIKLPNYTGAGNYELSEELNNALHTHVVLSRESLLKGAKVTNVYESCEE